MKPSSFHKFGRISARSSINEASVSSQVKRSIPNQTSVLNFFSLFFYNLLKKPIFLDTTLKSGIYICLATGGSLFFDFIKLPPCYLSSQRSLFNLYFVKLGWGWTSCSLAMYVVISAFVYTCGSVKYIRGHLMRILLGSFFWYLITGLFTFVESHFGQCYAISGAVMRSDSHSFWRKTCSEARGVWLGFDISGHCFLLVLCNLWISEELRVMQHWCQLGGILTHDLASTTSTTDPSAMRLANVSEAQFKMMRSAYLRLSSALRFIFCFTSCLSFLWDFMFMVTVVYFHSMLAKSIGTAIAIGCWALAYRLICPHTHAGSNFGISPGMPGDGLISFMPRV